MQLLNSNIPQSARTTKYNNKKAQDLLNLVLFMFAAFSYYKDGRGDGTWRFARRPDKQPHRAVWFAVQLFCYICFRKQTKALPCFFSPIKSRRISLTIKKKKKAVFTTFFFFLVEATGLEPTTSWSRTKRATKLRYTSINSLVIIQQIVIKIN